jgi:O-acetyl-ADP-ribose deacetylase (regulator of RNase III)
MKPIQLTDKFLQNMKVDAIVYGAKDTGEMGGGAASSVLEEAGLKILEAARKEFALLPSKNVGDVVITDSFNLKKCGIKFVCHLISIIKYTPQGAYCPSPEKLYDGVFKSIQLAYDKGARSIAFSAMGTGEGRVKPEHCARLMISAAKDFRKRMPNKKIDIYFSLPSYRDYNAFRDYLFG